MALRAAQRFLPEAVLPGNQRREDVFEKIAAGGGDTHVVVALAIPVSCHARTCCTFMVEQEKSAMLWRRTGVFSTTLALMSAKLRARIAMQPIWAGDDAEPAVNVVYALLPRAEMLHAFAECVKLARGPRQNAPMHRAIAMCPPNVIRGKWDEIIAAAGVADNQPRRVSARERVARQAAAGNDWNADAGDAGAGAGAGGQLDENDLDWNESFESFLELFSVDIAKKVVTRQCHGAATPFEVDDSGRPTLANADHVLLGELTDMTPTKFACTIRPNFYADYAKYSAFLMDPEECQFLDDHAKPGAETMRLPYVLTSLDERSPETQPIESCEVGQQTYVARPAHIPVEEYLQKAATRLQRALPNGTLTQALVKLSVLVWRIFGESTHFTPMSSADRANNNRRANAPYADIGDGQTLHPNLLPVDDMLVGLLDRVSHARFHSHNDCVLLVHLLNGALNTFRRQRLDDPASHVLVFTAWLCTALGGTGKSYLLQTLKLMLDHVIHRSRVTMAAMSTLSLNYGEVITWDEKVRASAQPTDDNLQLLAMEKEARSANEITLSQCFIPKNEKNTMARILATFKAEAVRYMEIFASNDDPSTTVDSSGKRRLVQLDIPGGERRVEQVKQLRAEAALQDPGEVSERYQQLRDLAGTTFAVAHALESLFSAGPHQLLPPNLAAAINKELEHIVDAQLGMFHSPEVNGKVEASARSLCLLTVAYRAYFAPGGVYYGERFEWAHVPLLLRMAVVQTSHVVAAVGSMDSQFASPISSATLLVLHLLARSPGIAGDGSSNGTATSWTRRAAVRAGLQQQYEMLSQYREPHLRGNFARVVLNISLASWTQRHRSDATFGLSAKVDAVSSVLSEAISKLGEDHEQYDRRQIAGALRTLHGSKLNAPLLTFEHDYQGVYVGNVARRTTDNYAGLRLAASPCRHCGKNATFVPLDLVRRASMNSQVQHCKVRCPNCNHEESGIPAQVFFDPALVWGPVSANGWYALPPPSTPIPVYYTCPGCGESEGTPENPKIMSAYEWTKALADSAIVVPRNCKCNGEISRNHSRGAFVNCDQRGTTPRSMKIGGCPISFFAPDYSRTTFVVACPHHHNFAVSFADVTLAQGDTRCHHETACPREGHEMKTADKSNPDAIFLTAYPKWAETYISIAGPDGAPIPMLANRRANHLGQLDLMRDHLAQATNSRTPMQTVADYFKELEPFARKHRSATARVSQPALAFCATEPSGPRHESEVVIYVNRALSQSTGRVEECLAKALARLGQSSAGVTPSLYPAMSIDSRLNYSPKRFAENVPAPAAAAAPRRAAADDGDPVEVRSMDVKAVVGRAQHLGALRAEVDLSALLRAVARSQPDLADPRAGNSDMRFGIPLAAFRALEENPYLARMVCGNALTRCLIENSVDAEIALRHTSPNADVSPAWDDAHIRAVLATCARHHESTREIHAEALAANAADDRDAENAAYLRLFILLFGHDEVQRCTTLWKARTVDECPSERIKAWQAPNKQPAAAPPVAHRPGAGGEDAAAAAAEPPPPPLLSQLNFAKYYSQSSVGSPRPAPPPRKAPRLLPPPPLTQ